MKENIKTDLRTKVITTNELIGKNGELVRFYNGSLSRYCYVPSGTKVSYYDTNLQKNKIVTISRNTSEIYKADKKITAKKPKNNHDIDHFLILENGDILAVEVVGDFYIKINEKECNNEAIEW